MSLSLGMIAQRCVGGWGAPSDLTAEGLELPVTLRFYCFLAPRLFA